MAIENFISVPYTEGPKLAAALEQHVKEYDVDVMDLQRAKRLVPADDAGGYVTVELESGATVQSRSVVLSTGARWRQMGVPGEAEYRNKGVTYCPHCDGPLFKGKRVAVIGGGNSGVEAAIDLAGVVEPRHAHRVRRPAPRRRGPAAQAAQPAERGRGRQRAAPPRCWATAERVTGLTYEDRTIGEIKHVDLEGVFVQIGLLPNTEWLDGTVELTDRG